MNLFKNPRRLIAATLTVLVISGAACSDDSDDDPAEEAPTAQDNINDRTAGVAELWAGQPLVPMEWSPTLETIDFWMRTWEEQGKLSYFYERNANGETTGYYVLQGLPVSYCVGRTAPWEIIDLDGPDMGHGGGDDDDREEIAPGPGMDGAYYGGCNDRVYYGRDAVTGAYQEWSISMGQSYRLFDQPLAITPELPNEGPTIVQADGSLTANEDEMFLEVQE